MELSIDDVLVKPLKDRLHQIETTHVHYEASFMGPHNTFLQSHFTARNLYMVKPTPRLQTFDRSFVDHETGLLSTSSVDSTTSTDSDSTTSTDSDSTTSTDSDSTISTDSHGIPVVRLNTDSKPDFVVCKMSAALDADIPVLIWELKRGKAGDAGLVQVKKYGTWLENYEARVKKPSDLPPISVFLVEKAKVSQYRVQDGQVALWDEYPSVLDPELHGELRALAGADWRFDDTS